MKTVKELFEMEAQIKSGTASDTKKAQFVIDVEDQEGVRFCHQCGALMAEGYLWEQSAETVCSKECAVKDIETDVQNAMGEYISVDWELVFEALLKQNDEECDLSNEERKELEICGYNPDADQDEALVYWTQWEEDMESDEEHSKKREDILAIIKTQDILLKAYAKLDEAMELAKEARNVSLKPLESVSIGNAYEKHSELMETHQASKAILDEISATRINVYKKYNEVKQ